MRTPHFRLAMLLPDYALLKEVSVLRNQHNTVDFTQYNFITYYIEKEIVLIVNPSGAKVGIVWEL